MQPVDFWVFWTALLVLVIILCIIIKQLNTIIWQLGHILGDTRYLRYIDIAKTIKGF